MKKYIDQFYSEGLALIFYLKPIKFLKSKIKNEKVLKVLSFIVKLIYTVLAFSFAILILYVKLYKK